MPLAIGVTAAVDGFDSGLVFFEECLKKKVIVVVGLGFDLSPIHRSNMFASPFHHYVRLSYGPDMDQVNPRARWYRAGELTRIHFVAFNQH